MVGKYDIWIYPSLVDALLDSLGSGKTTAPVVVATALARCCQCPGRMLSVLWQVVAMLWQAVAPLLRQVVVNALADCCPAFDVLFHSFSELIDVK